MGIEELHAMWNAQSDKYNSWDELGLDEIVAFAQEVEREACASLAEDTAAGRDAEAIAEAIRLRSNVI